MKTILKGVIAFLFLFSSSVFFSNVYSQSKSNLIPVNVSVISFDEGDTNTIDVHIYKGEDTNYGERVFYGSANRLRHNESKDFPTVYLERGVYTLYATAYSGGGTYEKVVNIGSTGNVAYFGVVYDDYGNPFYDTYYEEYEY